MPKSKMFTLCHNITRSMDTIQNLLERFFMQSAKLLIPSTVYSRCGHVLLDKRVPASIALGEAVWPFKLQG